MHIVHIASELAPVAAGSAAWQTCCLAFPASFHGKAMSVDVVVPKYDCMNSSDVRGPDYRIPCRIMRENGTITQSG